MGELLLDWKDHNRDLSNKLWEFFKEEYLVDFNVKCHGQQKKVHKFVLAFLIPMLKESRWSSGTFGTPKMTTSQCLNLNNVAVHAEDMDYLVQFAYTGKATVPKEHADCLMRIADLMGITSLKESLDKCHNQGKLTEDNVSNGITLLRSLRPRTQLKKISESVYTVSSDDDVDFNPAADCNMSNNSDSSDSKNEDNDEKTTGARRKKKTEQRKRRSEDDGFKEKSVKKQKSKKTSLKIIITDSDKEADAEILEPKILKCHQCEFVSKYPSRLEQHLKTHAIKQRLVPEDTKQFICKDCNNDIGSQSLLAQHRATNCGRDLFACQYCGHKTLRKSKLREHLIAVHQVDADGNPVEKNVKCPDCDYVCYANHQLHCHRRAKHVRANMFKCKECNYSAPYMSELVRHEREKHQNVRNYMCEKCGNKFQTSERLKHHVLVYHKGVKPFKCKICDAEYSSKLCFKVHLDLHEGKVKHKFVCNVCGHNSRRKVELRTHMRKLHGMELEETPSEPSKEPSQLQDAVEPTTT